MISQTVIDRLELSFGVERVEKAVDKFRNKEFKNDFGAEAYLRKVL